MAHSDKIAIRTDEKFRHLSHAPIVEAVIHWRARGTEGLRADEFVGRLQRELPDYPRLLSLNRHEVSWRSDADGGGAAQSHRTQWSGFRLETEDGRQVAQFTVDGFVFSRLRPYTNWRQFESEAIRLWGVHARLTETVGPIDRLGVRFINLVEIGDMSRIHVALRSPPKPPESIEFPIADFFRQTTYEIAGHAYRAQVIEATRRPSAGDIGLGLILDIDVFTTGDIDWDERILHARLAEMRWLKNKLFFSLLTDAAVAQFAEETP